MSFDVKCFACVVIGALRYVCPTLLFCVDWFVSIGVEFCRLGPRVVNNNSLLHRWHMRTH